MELRVRSHNRFGVILSPDEAADREARVQSALESQLTEEDSTSHEARRVAADALAAVEIERQTFVQESERQQALWTARLESLASEQTSELRSASENMLHELRAISEASLESHERFVHDAASELGAEIHPLIRDLVEFEVGRTYDEHRRAITEETEEHYKHVLHLIESRYGSLEPVADGRDVEELSRSRVRGLLGGENPRLLVARSLAASAVRVSVGWIVAVLSVVVVFAGGVTQTVIRFTPLLIVCVSALVGRLALVEGRYLALMFDTWSRRPDRDIHDHDFALSRSHYRYLPRQLGPHANPLVISTALDASSQRRRI